MSSTLVQGIPVSSDNRRAMTVLPEPVAPYTRIRRASSTRSVSGTW